MRIYKHKLNGEYIKLYYKPNFLERLFLNKKRKCIKYKILDTTYKYSPNEHAIISEYGKQLSIIDKEVNYINNVIRQSSF